jgi:hypothetical protein
MCEIDNTEKYTEVSFMLFRTGSVLIVGNCSEKCLMFVFEFIKRMLEAEYINIRIENDEPTSRVKKSKLRKKTIQVTTQYFQEVVNNLGV